MRKTSPHARHIQLLNKKGNPSAILVAYGKNCSAAILKRWNERPLESPKGNINSQIVDLFSRSIPQVATGLANGSMFQVIGTPELVQGINRGTHALMQTSTGTLGTVVNNSSGRIAGQLRFEQSSTLSPVIAPTMAWSLLNAVAGTVQLQRIDAKLGSLIRQIEKLSHRQEAEVMGRIAASMQILDGLLHEYNHTGNLNKLAACRLAEAEKDIAAIYERNRMLIEDFSNKADIITRTGGKLGAEQAERALTENSQSFARDVQILVALMAARNRVFQLHIYHDLLEQASYANERMNQAAQQIERHKEVLRHCAAVKILQDHANQCIREMNWFQRKIFNRSTVRRVNEAASTLTGHEQLPRATEIVPGFCFWQGEDGEINARLSPAISSCSKAG